MCVCVHVCVCVCVCVCDRHCSTCVRVGVLYFRCRLSGYENTLLGYKTRMYKILREHTGAVDVIMFGKISSPSLTVSSGSVSLIFVSSAGPSLTPSCSQGLLLSVLPFLLLLSVLIPPLPLLPLSPPSSSSIPILLSVSPLAGHLLFEMSCGYELTSLAPTPTDCQAMRCQPVMEVLF